MPPSRAAAKPPGPVEELDAGPLTPRWDVSVISTGHEIVVWGGDFEAFNMGLPGPSRIFNEGAAYDVTRGSWRTIAAAPISDDAEFGYAVWAGDEMVAFRGRHGASWDPFSNTWSALPDAPSEVGDLVWTGRDVIAIEANARLDPATRTWRELSTAPLELAAASAVWTGSELLVVGRTEPHGAAASDARGMAYDPSRDRWRALPPSGINAQAIDAVWDGRRLVVVNYDMTAATYEPTADTWQPLPGVPARFSEWYPKLETAGGRTVAFMSQSIVVLTEDDRWIPLAYGEATAGASAAVGDRIFAFGFAGTTNRFSSLSIKDLSAVRQIQVGIATLTLPADFRFEHASWDATHAGVVREAVTVQVSRGEMRCTATSTYGVPKFISRGKEIRVKPVDGSAAQTARVGPPPDRSVSLGPTSTDTILIRCDKARAARNLARSVSFE